MRKKPSNEPQPYENASKPWRHSLEFYRDSNRKWRWRLSHRNGHKLLASGESYANYTMAARSANRLLVSIQAGQCRVVKQS